MKIGVILDNEFITDIRVSNEACYLKSIGYEIHILCPDFDNHKEYEILNGIYIHRFKLKKSVKNKLYGLMNILPLYELFWIRKVRKFVKSISPDYLHAHDLYMSKIAFKGGNEKIPVILDLHENYPEAVLAFKWSSRYPHRLLTRPLAWKRKEQEYLSYAKKLIVLSNSFKDTLVNRYQNFNPDNIFVYPNVPDVPQMLSYPIKPDIFPKNDRFILFYFGGIGERRGIITCFEAIKILLEEIPSIHLLLIGPVDGQEQRDFDHYLNEPVLKERVTHYIWKDLSDFPSYTYSSDICLSPIFKDDQHESGVANKVFQYMLFGKPLIVSDCAPQIEIVEESRCGVVFSNKDADDLAAKIKFLYNNPELRNEMGENGRNAVLEKYNLEVCGTQLKLLYNSFPKNF
jgi:glycosyltransferase involved in cell wall biosynthesis